MAARHRLCLRCTCRGLCAHVGVAEVLLGADAQPVRDAIAGKYSLMTLSLIHISEPTRPY